MPSPFAADLAAAPPDPVVDRGEGWLALDKPAGLPVFPPHGAPGGDCLLARLLRACPEQARPPWPEGFAGGLAHRLDVATSGQVLAATSLPALARLRAAFADRALLKRYLFLTRREVPWTEHRLELPLAHDPRRKARMVVQRGQGTPHRGRWLPTWTRLERAGRARDLDGATLHAWHAEIRTGVMHQVRVHAAFSGLALAGDHLYGGGPPTAAAAAHGAEVGLLRPPFHLHHLGLAGPGLAPALLPPPAWWPPVVGQGA